VLCKLTNCMRHWAFDVLTLVVGHLFFENRKNLFNENRRGAVLCNRGYLCYRFTTYFSFTVSK
jgi:hypothetical protein